VEGRIVITFPIRLAEKAQTRLIEPGASGHIGQFGEIEFVTGRARTRSQRSSSS